MPHLDETMDCALRYKKHEIPICPFVQDPHNDCYCINMNSRKIFFTVQYCGNHFKNCNIYNLLKGGAQQSLDPLDDI